MKVIDVHCHVVPAEFPATPQSCERWPQMDHRANNQAGVMIAGKEFRLVDSRCWDTARRLADMNGEDVGMQVLSPMPELLSYWIDAKPALQLSRHVNRAISEMIRAAPDRFAGLGMVPLQDIELAAKELSVLRSEYGLSGIEIGSNILGRPPGDPSFDAFFAEAERLDLAVFVHALHPAATDRLIGPAQLAAFIGFPTDVGFAAASFITGRLSQKYPRLRVGFSHGGGTLPAFLPRLQSGWSKTPALQSSFASPIDAARRFYYDNVVFDRTLLRHLIDFFGTTQIFVGSDYPFTGGQQKSAQMYEGIGLSPTQLDALRGGNATRFLKLGEAAA
jgi:aminocarboxymuconate-semialdehyde decarboxylase